MNQRILIGILALQVVLIAAAFLNRLREPEVPEIFLDVLFEEVTSISIASDEESVDLLREGDSWVLGDGKPADGEKIERVFSDFTSVKGGWPVATSISSAERFEVADDLFQKHVVLSISDDVVADVYIGTSPGYRNIHARNAGSSSVYSIKFSSYELSTDSTGWLDKKLLSADGELTQIIREGKFTLTKNDGTWVSDPLVELDVEEVDTFVDRFADLSVYDFNDVDLAEIEPIQFTLTDAAGDYTLSMYHDEENDDWTASSNKFDGSYSISSYIAKQMTVQLDELKVETPEEEDVSSDAENAADQDAPTDD